MVPVLDGLVDTFPSLKVGSYPGEEGVRVRLEGSRTEVREAVEWLEERL